MTKQYVLKSRPILTKKLLIDYERELNDAQLEAVRTTQGPQLVIAGAGTGKTRTLVYRVAYLIEAGIDPRQILLLTFTKKAAQEMMRRAEVLLDERCSKIKGGTFHAYANLTLRRFAKLVGYEQNFSIVDRADAEDIINVVRTELNLTSKETRLPKKGTLLAILSKAANTNQRYEDILEEEYQQFAGEVDVIRKIAAAYARYKQDRSIMDYDDLLLLHRKLLEENPEVKTRLSLENFYIMIDEFQDTNSTQAEIAHLLASEHLNIMAVGDDSQSIYSFRGASFRNIMDFPKRYDGCKITKLEQNYRSSQPLLSFTNKIVEAAREKYSKTLFSTINAEQKPAYVRTTGIDEQSEFICQRVLELAEEGVKLNDISVLFRSGWHSNELEIALAAHNIPFVKYGGLKFVEAAHIKDVMAFLRVIYNLCDVVAWHRLLLLLEGIGPQKAKSIAGEIVNEQKSYAGLIAAKFKKQKFFGKLEEVHSLMTKLTGSGLNPEYVVHEVIQFYLPLLEGNYDDYRKRLDDLNSMQGIVPRYNSLEQFLDDLLLESPERGLLLDAEEDEGEDAERLILSTIHSAKGLEWHSVFVLSLLEGFLPSNKSMMQNDQVEEERRLFYVACTRAKRNLYLVCPQYARVRIGGFGDGGFSFARPSRFINEIADFESVTEEWMLSEEREYIYD